MRTFPRILIAAWMFFWGSVVLVIAFPKLLLWIPRPGITIKLFMLTLVLTSGGYGIAWIYRQGMNLARRK